MYVLPACTPAGQKKAPDLIVDCCELPCGCWELNSEPLEESFLLLLLFLNNYKGRAGEMVQWLRLTALLENQDLIPNTLIESPNSL